MVKYIEKLVDELKNLKKGMTTHSVIWAGQPVTAAQIQAAIDALEAEGNNIETAKAVLNQHRTTGRNLVEQYTPLAIQVGNLATGLHVASSSSLSDYAIPMRKNAANIPVPAKGIIASVVDDVDDEGFIITIQKLADADTFEIEKAVSDTPDIMVYTGKFTHLKTIKKLSFTDDDVLRGKRYFYRIRGFNRSGYGAWSEPVSRVQ